MKVSGLCLYIILTLYQCIHSRICWILCDRVTMSLVWLIYKWTRFVQLCVIWIKQLWNTISTLWLAILLWQCVGKYTRWTVCQLLVWQSIELFYNSPISSPNYTVSGVGVFRIGRGHLNAVICICTSVCISV